MASEQALIARMDPLFLRQDRLSAGIISRGKIAICQHCENLGFHAAYVFSGAAVRALGLPQSRWANKMVTMRYQTAAPTIRTVSRFLTWGPSCPSVFAPIGLRSNFSLDVAGLAFVIVFLLAPQTSAQTDTVSQLKAVQQKVASAVDRTMPACVAISDGVGFGSGVVVNAEGLVLTAGHVMTNEDGRKYEVLFPSGRTVPARPLGKNLNDDAGMLQLLGSGPWPHVKMNQAGDTAVGDWVITLGHSGGFELGRKPPVRVGRVIRTKPKAYVTDAILIGGDSGGPLFNLDGELIAIHTSIGDITADNRHVPLSVFRRDWARMKRGDSWGKLPELNEPGDKSRPGKIGVNVDRDAPNARIRKVIKGSAADEIGLLPGDVVVQFDNVIINDGVHLIEVVKRFHSGDVVPIKVRRNQAIMKLEIQLQ